MPESSVTTELRDGLAWVRLDDGKANALSPAVIEALGAALDRAEKEAGAVVLLGRPGRFSAGFDLSVMGSGPEQVRSLVTAGAELLMRLYAFPLPVVAACTGHALAAGSLLLLASDFRVGARGDFKIGLNEVAIGMTLPIFAVELARARLSKRHFDRATAQAEIYAPEAAVDAGFLDRLAAPDAIEEAAASEASRLAALRQPAFRASKWLAHRRTLEAVRETLAENMADLGAG